MKLTELVGYLRMGNSIDNLWEDFSLNKMSEQIIIYLKDELSINSDISFWEIGATNDDLEIIRDSQRYIALFSLEQTIEMIEEYLDISNESDEQIALAILSYRINDA